MAFKNGFFRNIFYNKKFVVAFSIIAAFLFWLVVTVVENPEREVTFSNINISMTMSDQASESGLEVITSSHETANVTVSGPSYILSTLSANDISVIAQLNDITEAGEQTVNLSALCAKAGEIKVVSVSPSRITANFDYRDTKTFTVEVMADGITCSDSKLTRGTPVVSNRSDATIDITGPRRELERVVRVVAKTDAKEAISVSKSYDAGIVLYDAAGNEINSSNFSLAADSINITVPILLERTLPLKVTFINTPAAYAEKDISHSLSISELTILGPESIVSDMEYIPLSSVDFNNISSSNNKFEVLLELPNGVKTLENINTVTVTVNTSGLKEKTLNVGNFRYNNLDSGLKATTSSIKNVVICGPRSIVNSIREADLVAEIDLSGKTAGKYTVAVKISAKDGQNIWQIGTYEVLVTIE